MKTIAARLLDRLRLTGESPGRGRPPEPPLGQLAAVVKAHDLTIFMDDHTIPGLKRFMTQARTQCMLNKCGVRSLGVEMSIDYSESVGPGLLSGNLMKLARELTETDARKNPLFPKPEALSPDTRRDILRFALSNAELLQSAAKQKNRPVLMDNAYGHPDFQPNPALANRSTLSGNKPFFDRLQRETDFTRDKAAIFCGGGHAAALKAHAENSGLSAVIVNLAEDPIRDLKQLDSAWRDWCTRKALPAWDKPAGFENTMSENVHFTISTGEIIDQRPKPSAESQARNSQQNLPPRSPQSRM